MNIPVSMERLLLTLLCCGMVFACLPQIDEPPKDDKDEMEMMKRTSLFALEGNWYPYSFMNEENGMATGFLSDLVKKVCDRCGESCGQVFIGEHLDRCMNLPELTADGLNNMHFDACVGWTPTVPRMNLVNFSSPILEAPLAQMYIRPTTLNIGSLDDIAGRKVGFRKYWFMDMFCARRYGVPVEEEDAVQVEVTNGWTDLVDVLKNREVDVIVLPYDPNNPEMIPGTDTLVPFGSPVSCTEDGYGLMFRKGAFEKLEWFGKCMEEMVYDGSFEQLCSDWGIPNCKRWM